MNHLITVFSDVITIVSTKKGGLWRRWSLAHLRGVQWKKEAADAIYSKGNTRKLWGKKVHIEVATHYNSKAVETPPLETFKTRVDNAFNNWFCSWSWPHLEQAVVTETSEDPFQLWVFYDKCQNAPTSLDIAPLHRYHLTPTSCYWSEREQILSCYHINENATYSMLSRPKKQKIKNLALLQALYVLGQTLYPCWIIPEQLQLGSKHIMTPLNTSDLCFQPSSPTTQDVLTELVCHTLPTPSSVCWLSSENWKASKLALSSKICITSPNFQEMTGLL